MISRKKIQFIKYIIPLLVICVSSEVYASEQQILDKIVLLENQILTWERDAFYVGFLAILTAMAGGIVTMLQGSTHRYTKPVLAILGIIVICLVTTQDQFFPSSRNEIKNKIIVANQKIDEVRSKIVNQSNKNINFYLKIIQELNAVLHARNNNYIMNFNIVRTAYAAKNNFIFYSGEAVNENVIFAEELAIKNAQINVAKTYIKYMVDNVNATAEELKSIDFIEAVSNLLVRDSVEITKEQDKPKVKVILKVNSVFDKEAKEIISYHILINRKKSILLQQNQVQQNQVQQNQVQQNQVQQNQVQQNQVQQNQVQQNQVQQNQVQQNQVQQRLNVEADELVTTIIKGELNRDVSKVIEASKNGNDNVPRIQ